MRFLLILMAAPLAACAGRDGARTGAGTVTVEWTGTLRGSFSAAAAARWCAADTLLEIIAVRGDTAVGITLIARDSVRPERYVVNEAQAFTPGRPQAGLALRMLGEAALLGFEGMGGRVDVTQGGSAVSGTLEARLRPVTSSDTLQITGSFDRVPVAPAAGVCGRANKPGGG